MSSLPAPAEDFKRTPAPAPEPLPKLTYSEGWVYRALYFLRMGAGKYPEAGTYDPARLLMRVNAYRFEDGRKPISVRQLRRLVSSLREKRWIEFRANRRRRAPTGKRFRRGTWFACLAPIPETVDYLPKGRERGQTKRPALLSKVAVDGTSRKVAVGGSALSNKSSPQVTKPASTGSEHRVQETDLNEYDDTEAVVMLEADLCGTVTRASEHDWEADDHRTAWRLSAVRRQLEAGDSVVDLELAAFGVAIARECELRRPRGSAFWVEGDPDAVLVALADVEQYRRRGLGWLAKVEGVSAGEIERTGEIWPDAWAAEHENTACRAEHAHRNSFSARLAGENRCDCRYADGALNRHE